MKRTFLISGLGTGLLATAVVATPAQADSVPTDVLAGTTYAAHQVAQFWLGEAKANLIGATPYNVETKVVAKHVSTGGPTADTKPGVVPAIGDEKKTTAKSKNVNLPKTSGKVFFLGADGEPHWCTGTSVQAAYRNLVATAGHCVYDTTSNKATLDKWVFIPGYYQGKTPWGIYVGKQAFTHYDFDVYEDGDRDYAFVTVYNGVLPAGSFSEVDKATYDKNPASFRLPPKVDVYETEAEAKAKQGKGVIEVVKDTDHVVALGTAGSVKETVPLSVYKKFNADLTKPAATGTGFTEGEVSKTEFDAAEAANDKVYFGPSHWYWHKNGKLYWGPVSGKYYAYTFWVNYDLDYKVTRYGLGVGLKDVGRLGDNVGGQGLAYNQKVGKPVFVFGYPSGSHPDGNYAYSGKTLKWTYGKTFAASAASIKAEELIGVKSSFTGEGALGSSWLLQYKSSRRLGYLNGVTIGVADTNSNARYDTSVSPYFDGELYGVYKAAAVLWSGKIV